MRILIFNVLLMLPLWADISPVVVKSSIDKAVISTEDTARFLVEVDRTKSIAVVISDIGQKINGFRIVDFGSSQKEEEDRVIETRWFNVRADVSGSYILPEIVFEYQDKGSVKSVKTSEIFVEVKPPTASMGASGETVEDIRDIKDLEIPKFDYVFWGILTSLVVLMGIAVGLFLRKRRSGVKSTPPVDPIAHALELLAQLKIPEGNDPTPLKRYYFSVSEILRVYVEVMGIRATDMTSEEIIIALKNGCFSDADKAELTALLMDTDLVKFTDHCPAVSHHEEVKGRAVHFIRSQRKLVETVL